MNQIGHPTQSWRVGAGREFSLDRPRIIGILNVTPDSFSDGGSYADFRQAAAAGVAMHRDGASVIDIGGESTRPGSQVVEASEQIRRTLPVIKELRRQLNPDQVLISIDTTQSEVARAALDGGADIINDISAGLDDARMLPLAASRRCGIVLMHRRIPSTGDAFSDQYKSEPDYGGDVVSAVCQFLAQRASEACQAGVHPQSIVIDPGLGFGKSVRQNYQLAGRIHELAELNYHVLSAASRKSFIGSISAEPSPPRRVAGSIAMSVAHWFMGIRLFRVHDVLPQWQALNVAAAVMNSEMVPQQIAPPTATPAATPPACYHA